MDETLSAPAVAMLFVLAICFVALVMLVVSLPGIKKFRQWPRTAHGVHGAGRASHPPGLRP